MNTIENNINDEYIVSKSKFITFLYKVNNIDEINKYLDEIKKEYKDATHYCYAYIIDNIKRFNDDKEPSGTAGIPILNVLENNNLNNILCVVVRYFGGIKLGAGGLLRAYTKSVTNALSKTNIREIKEGLKIDIIFSYDQNKVIDILLKNELIVNKIYDDNITYEIIIDKDNTDLINKLEIASIRVSIKDLVKY